MKEYIEEKSNKIYWYYISIPESMIILIFKNCSFIISIIKLYQYIGYLKLSKYHPTISPPEIYILDQNNFCTNNNIYIFNKINPKIFNQKLYPPTIDLNSL